MSKTQESFSFQAEVKQVLDIVVHSLYTDKEIFVRELVSNASDALEKLRHKQLSEKNIYEADAELEIKISVDEEANTLTLEDWGIGMTREELIENLGTIAHSGSKAFLEAIKQAGQNNDNLIGQFGVGFYSAFMVAEKVEVFTHSWKADAPSLLWTSDGSGNYTIEELDEPQHRGCKMVVHLKEEAKEFAQKDRIQRILEQYSSFVPFPIQLGDDKINTQRPLWLVNKNEITEDEYKAFYKFQAKAFDEPMDWLHFSADAPLAINTLLFIPTENMERFGFARLEPSVALHCRKVLIDAQPKGLLPEWLRFLKGVVDSADLPLNISRESMQDSALVQKLGKVITKKFIKHLDNLAQKNPEKYAQFWKTFGVFVKEGAVNDFNHREGLSKLLRFESSLTEAGKTTALKDYLERVQDSQDAIYYMSAPDRASHENSPYMEAFKARNIEVLFLYEPVDEFVMQHLSEFEGKKLLPAQDAQIDLENVDSQDQGEALNEDQLKELCTWIQETLGSEKVSTVQEGQRLVDSPVLALVPEGGMNAQMRRMMQAMGDNAMPMPAQAVTLEINPRHALIHKLAELQSSNETLAKLMAEQLLDSALVNADMLDNPRTMINRMHELLSHIG